MTFNTKKAREALRERLAESEHARWARWQKYLHSKCLKNSDGGLTIVPLDVLHWENQIDRPYADLTEREKDSDRKEADITLGIVDAELASLRAQLVKRDECIGKLRGVADLARQYIEHCRPPPPKHSCGPEQNCDGDCVDWAISERQLEVVDKALAAADELKKGE